MPRTLLRAAALVVLAIAAAPPPVPAAGPGLRVEATGAVPRGIVTSVTLTLPRTVAAVEGRVLFAPGAVELVGVAPRGGGVGLRPAAFDGGAWFGAHGLRPGRRVVELALVVVPRVAGRLDVRVVVDAAAGRDGRPIALDLERVATLGVGRSGPHLAAPQAPPGPRGIVRASTPRELVVDGRFNGRDVDVARLEWLGARERGQPCGGGAAAGDANGDGCADIVDIAAMDVRRGSAGEAIRPAAGGRAAGGQTGGGPAAGGSPRVRRPRGDGTSTFTVRSTADTRDVAPGDGRCADRTGRCTLRAAIMEADWLRGDDRIAFDLAGAAPVVVQLSSELPIITSRAGTLLIDGYTQPGASVNTAVVGSNGLPGVILRGNGPDARESLLRITSGGNTVRGLGFVDAYRSVMLDGEDATGNRIVGDWVGFTRRGGTPAAAGREGIQLNTGASGNLIGGPDPADRNVIGHLVKGVYLYGPGTDANLIRGNQLCIAPSGRPATCNVGVDANFGPKRNVIGGEDPRERNVIGPTLYQGVELSHGWDPSRPWGSDRTTTWRIDANRVVGNWVGFRVDGSYHPAYRSGQDVSRADNGNGINAYDGVNESDISGNWVASVYDGIQVQAPNAQRNVVRGNVIGESPRGEPAPLGGWGVVLRWATRFDLVEGNVIRHAREGGIALLRTTNTGAAVSTAANIRISRNIVTQTSGLAVDLFGRKGADANDRGDADEGGNTLLNTPVITFADVGAVTGSAAPGATVEVFRATRAPGDNGLPVAFLGEAVAAADGRWQVLVSGLAPGDRVTALQIVRDGNTSELAANVAIRERRGRR